MPRIYDAELKREMRAQQTAAIRALEAKVLGEIETRRQDVETRIAAQRP